MENLVLFIVVFSILFLIFAVAYYIVSSLALWNLAKLNNKPRWMAWTPIMNNWLLIDLNDGYGIVAIISIFSSIIGLKFELIGEIISFIISVYILIYFYKLVVKYNASKICFWIGTIILPFQFVCWIQILRNTNKILEERLV